MLKTERLQACAHLARVRGCDKFLLMIYDDSSTAVEYAGKEEDISRW